MLRHLLHRICGSHASVLDKMEDPPRQAPNELITVSQDALPSPSSSFVPPLGLLMLPRDCLLRILSALRAPDVCRMAQVCRLLREIVDSNETWTFCLPSNPTMNADSFPKRDLYFRGRGGMIYKNLSQPYWLDPETGEGVFLKSARDLRIVWGNDDQYWGWERQAESWFAESAYLRAVCWLEVTGEFAGMFLPGAYTVSFRLKFTEDHCWSLNPLKLFLSTSNGEHIESRRFLNAARNSEISNLARLRSSATSSWMELDIGQFDVLQETYVKLEFRMMEIEGGNWKRGLWLDCVKIHPTHAISRNAC